MVVHLENEAALVAEARDGGAEAFTRLSRQYSGRIYGLAFSITDNQADAEDVLQEALLKAYRSLGNFRGDSRFYTWLVRIAINEALMKVRQRRAVSWVSLDEPIEADDRSIMPREIEAWGDNPEQSYTKSELQGILDKAVEQLEPRLRIVFLLRDVEGFSIEETAGMLGLSQPAVKTRLLRARLKLRERLTKFFRRG